MVLVTSSRDDTAALTGRASGAGENQGAVGYNYRFDLTHSEYPNNMEAERLNALSALLNDLTSREAELRRYL